MGKKEEKKSHASNHEHWMEKLSTLVGTGSIDLTWSEILYTYHDQCIISKNAKRRQTSLTSLLGRYVSGSGPSPKTLAAHLRFAHGIPSSRLRPDTNASFRMIHKAVTPIKMSIWMDFMRPISAITESQSRSISTCLFVVPVTNQTSQFANPSAMLRGSTAFFEP